MNPASTEAPMPRLPPVTSVMPSARMVVVLAGRREQPAGDQLAVGRDHMIRNRGDRAVMVGIAAAEITARAHEHVNDGLELLIAEIIDRARLPGALQDPDIGGGNVVEVLLVAAGREEFRLVEDAQEFRHLADEIEERAEPFDFLPCCMRGAGTRADETHHVQSDFRQQLIEQFLAVFEMIVECALRDSGLFGDPGDRGFCVTILADDFGGGVEYPAFGPRIALDAIEFCNLAGGGRGDLCHALASSSLRSTRLSTLPDGLRGRLSRRINCFGTLKAPSRARQGL